MLRVELDSVWDKTLMVGDSEQDLEDRMVEWTIYVNLKNVGTVVYSVDLDPTWTDSDVYLRDSKSTWSSGRKKLTDFPQDQLEELLSFTLNLNMLDAVLLASEVRDEHLLPIERMMRKLPWTPKVRNMLDKGQMLALKDYLDEIGTRFR